MKEMCWLSVPGNQFKVLHLRENSSDRWKPYTAFHQYIKPDIPVRSFDNTRNIGSKGWATYQFLSQAGWKLVSSAEAVSGLGESIGAINA